MAKVRSNRRRATDPSPLSATVTGASDDSANGLVDAVGPAANTPASVAEVVEESVVSAGTTYPDSVEPPVAPKEYTASVYCPQEIPQPLAQAVQDLEQSLVMPVWLLIQKADPDRDYWTDYCTLDWKLKAAFFEARASLPKKTIALVIDSPGGEAQVAYEVARLLQRCCGSFVAVVPSYAKSGATLLSLGAESILLGEHAQLGPLDVQVTDPEREEDASALDQVKALNRLHAFALEAVDNTMVRWLRGSQKKISTLFPIATKFIANMTRPLLEKIDAVHYTQLSRMLQVAEEYAFRLMMRHYESNAAQAIARALVNNYPEHAFVIDPDEAADTLGLHLFKPPAGLVRIVDRMKVELDKLGRSIELGELERFIALGQLQEKQAGLPIKPPPPNGCDCTTGDAVEPKAEIQGSRRSAGNQGQR
jgi:hypothetical protein